MPTKAPTLSPVKEAALPVPEAMNTYHHSKQSNVPLSLNAQAGWWLALLLILFLEVLEKIRVLK